ncbi:MAG: type II secretion system F family protein, partial [Bacillota bacterium]|nr:type II secretion system F family protein [Bacillota bacterium]
KVFGSFGEIVPQKGYLNKRKKKLIQAAVLMKSEEFLGLSVICAIALGFLMYLITNSFIMLIIFLPIGFIIPDLILDRKKSRRMAKLNSQLPEALNVISNGVRAGYSFTQAIGTVTKEITGPISDEFNKVLRDNLLGKPLEETLVNMSDRTDDEDLDIAITALIIQRQVGGNLAEVLDSISSTIRERVKVKRDLKTMTAQGRLSAVIVSLMPFAMAAIISIINPGYLNVLFTTLMGKIMIIFGITFEIAGILILIKLVNIKV